MQPCRDSLTAHDQRTSDRPTAQLHNTRRFSPLTRPASIYTELGADSRSRSLPLLDSSSDKEQSYCLSTAAHTPPRPVRQPALGDAAHQQALCRASSSASSLEQASGAAVYHLAGSTGLCETRLQRQEDVVYTEVSSKPDTLSHGAESNPDMNTYEPVEDLRPRQKQACWGLKVSTIHTSTCMCTFLIPFVSRLFCSSCRTINGNGRFLRSRESGEELQQ